MRFSDRKLMSSKQMGTWPQLIGCALFEILSLILECELREQKGYLTGKLSVQKVSTENQKITKGVKNIWKCELGKLRWMSQAENG